MLAKTGPSGEPIATPSVSLYMMLLKLKSTPDVALFISSMKTAFEMMIVFAKPDLVALTLTKYGKFFGTGKL